MTGNGIPRVEIGLGKLSRNTQSGKGCKSQWYLISVQMFASQITSVKQFKLDALLSMRARQELELTYIAYFSRLTKDRVLIQYTVHQA